METLNTDILVIGGSANGSQAARTASKQGVDVIVLEEHTSIGYPEHCSGLFSYEGLKQIDSIPPEQVILNKNIKGAYIYSPSNKILEVKKPHPHALVVDRAKFDQFLAEKAKKNGTRYLLNHKALDVSRKQGKWEVKILNKKNKQKIMIATKIIIDAEGHRRTIAKKAGLLKNQKTTIINAAQFYYQGLENLNPEMVELFQTSKYAKGFFGWIIPINKHHAKIGLGTIETSAAKKLKTMIKNHAILNKKIINGTIYRKTAGRILIDGPLKKTYSKGFLLVGDAAGQIKPTTGGGVILGGIAAQIAGKVAAEAVQKNNYSESFLKKYQKQWKKEIGRNLLAMKWVRNYLNSLNDQTIDQLFDILLKDKIKRKIENIGHVDNQIKIVFSLLIEPSLYPYYFKTAPKLIKALFS